MLLKLAKLQKLPKKGWKSCKSHHKKVGKIARNCYHRDRKVAKCSMWDDFMLKRSAKKYIDSWIRSGRDAKDLLMRLSLVTKQPLEKGRTIIFLDEVQEFKDIVTRVKFLLV